MGRLRSRLSGGVIGAPPGVVQVNQGDYNATTNAPDLDFSDSAAAAGILAGFSWEVTVGGLFFTEAVEPGDVLVANIDDPKLLGDWRRINKNIPVIAPILVQNTLFVDTTYTNAPVVDDPAHQFATIAAAFTASSAGDKIVVAPGAYAEALVVPHDLFIEALGVTGLTSIDISSGYLNGIVGKIRFNSFGAVIHPDTNAVDNANCVLFAIAAADTQSTNIFTILALSGKYDLVSGRIALFDTLTNGDLIRLIGMGRDTHFFNDNTLFPLIRVSANTGVENLRLELVGGPSTRPILQNSGVAWVGSCKNIETPNDITLSDGVATSFNGQCENIKCGQIKNKGTLGTNSTNMINIDSEGNVDLDEFGGTLTLASAFQITCNKLLTNGVIDMSRVDSSTFFDFSASSDILGLVILGSIDDINNNSTTRTLSGNFVSGYTNRNDDASFVGDILTDDFRLLHSKIGRFGGLGTTQHTLIHKSIFEFVRFNLRLLAGGGSGANKFATCENIGRFSNCTFDFDPDDTGQDLRIPVTTGAIFNNCVFNNLITGSTDPLDAKIHGRDLIRQYGSSSDSLLWDFSEQKLVYPLASQPQESDGSNGIQAIASGTTFDATIYNINPAGTGDDLTALEGLLVEHEVFLDAADIHGFGAGTWLVRTTATDAALINTTLGSPAGDLSPQNAVVSGSASSRIGMAATITMNNSTFDGLIGQEITLSTGPTSATSQSFDMAPDSSGLTTIVDIGETPVFCLDPSVDSGAVVDFDFPDNINLITALSVRAVFTLAICGVGSGSDIVVRVTVKYIAVGELFTKAADEVLTISSLAVVNTLNERQADIAFPLSKPLLEVSDHVEMHFERVGTAGLDNYMGKIGIGQKMILKYAKG